MFVKILGFLDQSIVGNGNLTFDKLLIGLTISSCFMGLFSQALSAALRIFTDDNLDKFIPPIEGLIFFIQNVIYNTPMLSFIILYGDICSKIQLNLKQKMACIKNSTNCLKDCENFFDSVIRNTNELFSTFLFIIMGPYLIIITFGTYLFMISLAKFSEMNLQTVMFAASQAFLTIYSILAVFLINYFSDSVASAFQEYKVINIAQYCET